MAAAGAHRSIWLLLSHQENPRCRQRPCVSLAQASDYQRDMQLHAAVWVATEQTWDAAATKGACSHSKDWPAACFSTRSLDCVSRRVRTLLRVLLRLTELLDEGQRLALEATPNFSASPRRHELQQLLRAQIQQLLQVHPAVGELPECAPLGGVSRHWSIVRHAGQRPGGAATEQAAKGPTSVLASGAMLVSAGLSWARPAVEVEWDSALTSTLVTWGLCHLEPD